MNDPRDSVRNPLVIPEKQEMLNRRGCPVCKKADYGGAMVGGVVTFKCRACGNSWQGGVGMVAQRNDEPVPPQNPKDAPLVDFGRNPKTGEVEEFRPRKPSPAPAFRGGAPVQGDDNDV